jgi:hypothetical protein
MAPTKAKATYAVTTPNLLTKVMGKAPWFTSLPANAKVSKPFPAEKVSPAVARHRSTTLEPPPTWLKTRKIKALKSP